jgi:archaemetzincin
MLPNRLSGLPFNITILKGTDIPKKSFNPQRDQFESSYFLELIRKYPGDRVLGITDVDLYAEPLNFVFGQAEIHGKPAVISLARLKGEKEIYESRTVKEAVHELGHTLGLRHCDEEICVMHFSNSLKDTDIKGEKYCMDCEKELKESILF